MTDICERSAVLATLSDDELQAAYDQAAFYAVRLELQRRKAAVSKSAVQPRSGVTVS